MAVCDRFMYVGIDPGLDGAITFIDDRNHTVASVVVPTIKMEKGSAKRIYDSSAMVDLLVQYVDNISMVCVEKGRAAPGQGVTSMFRFGYGCGLWEGILAALRVPYMVVHPRTWQKVVCTGMTGDAKSRAMQAAKSMFPTLDLKASSRSTKPHQGKADATCIAFYAKAFNRSLLVDTAIDLKQFSEPF